MLLDRVHQTLKNHLTCGAKIAISLEDEFQPLLNPLLVPLLCLMNQSVELGNLVVLCLFHLICCIDCIVLQDWRMGLGGWGVEGLGGWGVGGWGLDSCSDLACRRTRTIALVSASSSSSVFITALPIPFQNTFGDPVQWLTHFQEFLCKTTPF